MAAPTNYEIGTTLAGIQDIRTAGIIEPKAEFNEYVELANLQSGQKRGLGLPFATWLYGYLTQAQYDALRTFCTGRSASIFIATINNDNDFKRYAGIIEMPERYTIRDGDYIDVEVIISHLVEQSST